MARRHRPTYQTPDLFAAATAQGPRPEWKAAAGKPGTERRHLLPGDLPAALTHLEDSELEALAKAVAGEFHRRGLRTTEKLVPPPPQPSSLAKAGKQKRTAAKVPKSELPALTQARINAIRAAFKAGVKPATIARQFGVGQAAVRQVLSDKKG